MKLVYIGLCGLSLCVVVFAAGLIAEVVRGSLPLAGKLFAITALLSVIAIILGLASWANEKS